MAMGIYNNNENAMRRKDQAVQNKRCLSSMHSLRGIKFWLVLSNARRLGIAN